MNYKEARKRLDYKFSAKEIEYYIKDIRNNWMENMYENGDPLRGIAVMEIGYVDIEVNLYTKEQCIIDAAKEDKRPVISYFVCIKHGDSDNDWESDDYLDYEIKIDWNADNWEELLEKDMFEALNRYVKEKGYSYDSPN